MQQAIYNSINSTRKTNNTAAMGGAANAPKATGLARRMAGRWDMTCVLALMGSSAAYGVFALAHLGL